MKLVKPVQEERLWMWANRGFRERYHARAVRKFIAPAHIDLFIRAQIIYSMELVHSLRLGKTVGFSFA